MSCKSYYLLNISLFGSEHVVCKKNNNNSSSSSSSGSSSRSSRDGGLKRTVISYVSSVLVNYSLSRKYGAEI